MKIKFNKVMLTMLVAASFTSVATQASAANIGNWSGSGRSWNNWDFSTIKSTMISAGHTVEADEAITAANLANDQLLIVGEAGFTPSAPELSILSSWVNGGGRLLVFADSGNSGAAGDNGIFSGLGSSLLFSGSASNPGTLQAGNFATNNIYNIVGNTLSTTPGTAISGGSVLAGDYIHYQQIGSGWVFAFADRSDHNYFNATSANTNGQLLLNIAGANITAVVPEPETYAMLLAGLGLMGFTALRRKQNA